MSAAVARTAGERRVLLLADRVPRPSLRPTEHRLLQLLAELTCAVPRPTVTLLVADWGGSWAAGGLVDELGIETVSHAPDWEGWLAAQQLDLIVVHGSVAARRFGALLDTTHSATPRIVDASALTSRDGVPPTAPLDGDEEGRALALAAAEARDRETLASATVTLCASEHEAQLVRELAPAAATVVLPSHVSTGRATPPRSMRRGVLVVGSFEDGPGSPDEDAALFLAGDVLPVASVSSEVQLQVLGEDAPPIVRSLQDGARFHLARGSITPWLDSVRGVVAVRRYGRGTTAGVLAAAASGVPVVAGARVGEWHDLPAAMTVADDSPDALATAIAGLATEDRAWDTAARATSDWAARQTHERYRATLTDALTRAGAGMDLAGAPALVPWSGRTHGRWLPNPECVTGPHARPLDLALADEVTTDGMPEPDRAQDFPIEPLYDEWVRQRDATVRQRWADEERAAALPFQPLVTVVVAVSNTAPEQFERTVASLRAQSYARWELCVTDDASTEPATLRALTGAAAGEPRVRLGQLDAPSGIATAANAALARARGDFVAFVEPGDALEPLALLEIVELLNRCPELDVVYTDEHGVDPASGRHVNPMLKPSWSPDLLRSTSYLGALTVLRRALVDAVGGLRADADGALGYDLALRVTEQSDRVGHAASPLVRTAHLVGDAASRPDPAAAEAGRQALEESVARDGATPPAVVEHVDRRGTYRVRYGIVDAPFVQIVIPTRDRCDLLDTAIQSIRERSTYPRFEIAIVDNASTDPETLAYLERHDGPVLRYPAPFNYARMMNLAIDSARADLLLFVNNDVEAFQPDWIEAMAEHAQRPTVGAVGARLWYPSGTPQHQGIFVGGSGRAHNADFVRSFVAGDDRHFIKRLGCMVANFAAVTGACLMARPSALADVGGFEERLHVAFNDVDLCLKLRTRGYDIVCTPFATLVHHESATRGSTHPMENDDWFGERWGVARGYQDPYSNPNYDQERRFALRPPSVGEPTTPLSDAS